MKRNILKHIGYTMIWVPIAALLIASIWSAYIENPFSIGVAKLWPVLVGYILVAGGIYLCTMGANK